MDRRLLLFLALASVFMAGNAMAATDLSHADTSVQGLLDLVLQQSHQWSAKLYDYAIRLFWLGGIELIRNERRALARKSWDSTGHSGKRRDGIQEARPLGEMPTSQAHTRAGVDLSRATPIEVNQDRSS